MHAEQRIGRLGAPLVHRDLHPAGIDPVLALGLHHAGIRARGRGGRIGVGHAAEATGPLSGGPNPSVVCGAMDRRGLIALTVAVAALPFVSTVLAACGDDTVTDAAATLPPIATTTSTTILITTTTAYIPIQHQIAPGENLGIIADMYRVDYDELIALNGILDPDHIEAGDVLDIPAPTTTSTTTTSTTTTTLPPTTTTTG
ncbi:MAG: LysM peptidoglycan-binding domain-containing protein [Actinobacteria bacterium]|nr:LysM peptidoglycan-binding domain-containing protein [Actinomycetota bacterium]